MCRDRCPTHAGLDNAYDGASLGRDVPGARRQGAGVPKCARKGRYHGNEDHLPVGGVDAPARVSQKSAYGKRASKNMNVITCWHGSPV